MTKLALADLNAFGIYPLCPGDPNDVVVSPSFPRATLHLEGGKTLFRQRRREYA